MVAKTFLFVSALIAVGMLLLAPLSRASDTASLSKAGEYTLTGPYAHENLTLYLVHGPDRLKGRQYVTFQQALQDKIVVVHETGNVNELQIENVSNDVDVYIQSGQIVKGGRQDRTIATDVIIPPRSGIIPLGAFCVEHGRWSRRGSENAAAFDSSVAQLAGKSLKIAVQKDASQAEVWKSVKQNQDKLSANAGQNVADPRSSSSYQLTLENKKVQESTEAYSKKLGSIINDQPDAIGYAIAINGKVSSADVYASHELFAKLWPKLLGSAAVEAFGDLQKDKIFEPVKSEAVKAIIEDADKAQPLAKDVSARVQLVTRESKDNISFETRGRQPAAAAATGEWVHRSYLNKEGYVAPSEMPERNINIREQRENQQQAIPQGQQPPVQRQEDQPKRRER